MQEKELYEHLLGLKAPWNVSSVDLRIEESKVTVRLTHEHGQDFAALNADKRLRISWDQAWGIMNRAVSRGLERRE